MTSKLQSQIMLGAGNSESGDRAATAQAAGINADQQPAMIVINFVTNEFIASGELVFYWQGADF